MLLFRRLVTAAVVGAAAQTGAIYLFRERRRRYAGERTHILVTQGGAHLRPAGEEIRDAVVSVLMGGVALDMRMTDLPRRPAHLDILAVMGGVTLVVPATWNVRIDVEPTMAGIIDGRPGTVDHGRPPDLLVSGRVVMGGLAVRNELPRGREERTTAG